MNQLTMFVPVVIRYSNLLAADSPKQAYYNIRIEYQDGNYRVCKESGYGSRLLNAWERVFDSLSEAEKHYERIVRDKTNIQRRSPRKYRAVGFSGVL